MNDELFEQGLEIRKSVLGAEFVEKAIAAADDFNMQNLIIRIAVLAAVPEPDKTKEFAFQP